MSGIPNVLHRGLDLALVSAVEHDDELVAAPPCDQVTTAVAAAQPSAHRGQYQIADGVTMSIVDVLEPVQVDNNTAPDPAGP